METTKMFQSESVEPTRTPQMTTSAHLLMNYVIFEQGVEAYPHVTLNTPENRSQDTLATETLGGWVGELVASTGVCKKIASKSIKMRMCPIFYQRASYI